MRVTEKVLQSRLDIINRRLKTELVLNNAPCYGGYNLTSKLGTVRHRVPPKEMLNFLDGFLLGLDIERRD
jgi:hypothetical protein